MSPCIRCGEPAVGQYCIDIDVAPWRFCESCRLPVWAAIQAAWCGDEKTSRALLNKPKKASNRAVRLEGGGAR